MKNPYQELMEAVSVPEGLNERVLRVAREQKKRAVSKRPAHARPLLRAAACGVCALALVLGSITCYHPAERGAETDNGGAAEPSGVPVLGLSFGLTAYAAETGESYLPNANSGLAFIGAQSTGWSENSGCYTGCLFQITGEHIAQVSLSLDRGGFYRWRLRENLTDQEAQEIREAQERGELAPASIDGEEGGPWFTQEARYLGNTVTEDYDPAARYGLWTQGTGIDVSLDPKTAFQKSVDQLDGAALTVTVIFQDGQEQIRTYRLSTGKLRYTENKDGTSNLLPQLAGDNEPYVYGVYAVSETESRWLQWPVEGANGVSMSYPFGSWERTLMNENEDGEEEIVQTTVVHNGIDIPALAGTAVLAAADGTVTESGFDAERGNYVILDHGGGLRTVYGTCQEITVSQGDTVTAGQEIALVGSTGMSTGSHLCFQVWQDGEAQNPVAYFDSAVRATLEAAN